MRFEPAWKEISPDKRVALFKREGMFLFAEAWLQPRFGLWHYQVMDFFAEDICYASGNSLTPLGAERLVRDQIALLFHAGFRNQTKQVIAVERPEVMSVDFESP